MVTTLAMVVDATQYRDDAQLRRGDALPRWSPAVYGDEMPQRRTVPPGPTAWMRYLRGIQERHGWSVARVARESDGQISRATLFRMINGDTRRVGVDVVRLVAEIVGDDPDAVLKEVAGSVTGELEPRDPRLDGLDPNDPVVVHILSLDVDEEMRGYMLDRRRQILALRREQDMQEVDIIARRERGAA